MALFGSPTAGAAKTVCIMAAIVAAVAVVASFITWKNGGGTPLTEEESK
jgi:hypothetical protein